MRNVVVTVLKTGEFYNQNKKVEYSPSQVRWLKKQVEENCKVPHDFLCLTDLPEIEGVKIRPLLGNYPGWWSKMELFNLCHLDLNVTYFDLDTVITGDITHIVEYVPDRIQVLKNLSTDSHKEKFGVSPNGRIGSGIMKWCGDYRHLRQAFQRNPKQHMETYVTSERWGDQGFIQDYVQGGWDYLQDTFPNQMVSYKYYMLRRGLTDPPPGVNIVIFHGKPKPWEIEANWVPNLGV